MAIDGVKQIKGFRFIDDRGAIQEVLKDFPVRSITHTNSLPKTLRGVHVQEWEKVVYLASGQVYVVLYDDRPYYSTYQKTMEFVMNPGDAYLIPAGVGNSYCVISETPVDYFYFNKDLYNKKRTYTISYKKFKYPIEDPIVSEEDENA